MKGSLYHQSSVQNWAHSKYSINTCWLEKPPVSSIFKLGWHRILPAIIPMTAFFTDIIFYKGIINEAFLLCISNLSPGCLVTQRMWDTNSQNLGLEHFTLEDQLLHLTIWTVFGCFIISLIPLGLTPEKWYLNTSKSFSKGPHRENSTSVWSSTVART